MFAVCERILPGPEAAARAASQASGKDRAAAEAAISAAVTDALHLLGTLTTLLPLMTGELLGGHLAERLNATCMMKQSFLWCLSTSPVLQSRDCQGCSIHDTFLSAPQNSWFGRVLEQTFS